MRVFLSHYDNFSLAFPIENVASIIIYKDNKNDELNYVSLPEVFNFNNIDIHHGVALKNSNFILLTAKIDSEINISQKNIFAVPKTLGIFESSMFFSGIKFIDNKLVLILNTEHLLNYIQKERK